MICNKDRKMIEHIHECVENTKNLDKCRTHTSFLLVVIFLKMCVL